MLCNGESYNERKSLILRHIKTCREFIRLIDYSIKLFPENKDVSIEAMKKLHDDINEAMADITKLECWRKLNKLEKDEPYERSAVHG